MALLDFLKREDGRAPAHVGEPPIEERASPIPVVKRVHRHYHAVSSAAIYTDFIASQLSADAELVTALPKLRARARNLERNSGHARRFIQLMQDNVVGPSGFMLGVSMKFASTGKLKKIANDSVEMAWRQWAAGAVTADGMMNMLEVSRAAVRAYCRDGEAFIQIIEGTRFDEGFALHFVEADLVDDNLNRSVAANQNEIRMGVEIDEFGAPVAYWVLTAHPGDHQWGRHNLRNKHVRVPAEKMIHVFEKRRPGQTRGEPPMAPVMNDIKMLAGYRESELVHRRVAASKMGFFYREEAAGPVKGLADEVLEDGTLEMDADPGRMKVLPDGYKFQSFDANSTHTDYAAYEKQIIRSFATGLGPSYFDLGMDLDDVSYSSIRQGALSDRDFYRGVQGFFIFRLMMPIYRKWLKNIVGFRPDVAVRPTQMRECVQCSVFRGRGWSWVDPQKEVKAARDAVEASLTSRTAVTRDQGVAFSSLVDEISNEREIMEDAGLDPDIPGSQPQNPVVDPEENTE